MWAWWWTFMFYKNNEFFYYLRNYYIFKRTWHHEVGYVKTHDAYQWNPWIDAHCCPNIFNIMPPVMWYKQHISRFQSHHTSFLQLCKYDKTVSKWMLIFILVQLVTQISQYHNIMVQWLSLLFHIREVLIPGPKVCYPEDPHTITRSTTAALHIIT